jgi:hypothetical protein
MSCMAASNLGRNCVRRHEILGLFSIRRVAMTSPAVPQ